MSRYIFTATTLWFALFLCVRIVPVQAQQPGETDQTYETAVAKATADCAAIWADHNLDPVRDKVPLGEDNKPTPAMLANPERLRAEDKPLADLAIKALGQCRKAWAPAWAMQTLPVKLMIGGVQRKQDALIADLYSGAITWGDFNAAMDRLNGEFEQAVSSTQSPPALPAAAEKSAKVSEPVNPPPANQNTPATSASREVRVALVIGDSNYSNLPKLSNPANDARAIAELLQKIGFTVRLVPDASEANLRREVRKFASDSAKADIAFVFYAGHGAQVGGQNYVLPVDMDIPQTEADIAFTGLKVDDLVNSIRAKTKIVFLDACRDNPALFANLVKGRGSYAKGLAPAVGSNFEEAGSGGGVFIAYATDSGSVALDGQGEHSPFTQALLRNLDKPISIDDMFSLVTREVRLVTRNAQRPYKYASLENIVCLTGSCSTVGPIAPDADIVIEAERSEAEELQIALQTNNPDALETYLQKYPESTKRNDIWSIIAAQKRSEFDEWTMFQASPEGLPAYLKLNSIWQSGDRAAVKAKIFISPGTPIMQQHPDALYTETTQVIDCKNRISATAETTVVGNSGQVLYRYKWADPEFLDMSLGAAVAPGTFAETLEDILCFDQFHIPLLRKNDLTRMAFTSVSSTINGDGDVFFVPTPGAVDPPNGRDLVLIFRMHQDKKINLEITVKDAPTFRTELDRILLRCDQSTSAFIRGEYYDGSNNLVYMTTKDYSKEASSQPWNEKSPFAVLQRIACKPKEAAQ